MLVLGSYFGCVSKEGSVSKAVIMSCGWSVLFSKDNMLEQSWFNIEWCWGCFCLFRGKMDVLHPAVFSGWLNAAAIAHEWGSEPYLVPLYFFLSMILLYINMIMLFYDTYIWIAQSLFILSMSSGHGQLYTLSFHHWNHSCCMTHTCNSTLQLNPSNLSWNSSQLGGIKMYLSQAQTMLWRDFTGPEPKFSLKFKIWSTSSWTRSSIFTSKVPLPQPTSSSELV